MATNKTDTAGTKDNPFQLKTPPGTSEYTAYDDAAANPPALVVLEAMGLAKVEHNARNNRMRAIG